MDATIFLSESIPVRVLDYSFFTIKDAKRTTSGFISKGLWSGFFIGGAKGSRTLNFVRDVFYEYLKSHKSFPIYFLFDCVIALGYEEIAEVREEIDKVPDNNKGVHELCRLLQQEDFLSEEESRICKYNYAHKLTWKSANNSILCSNLSELVKKMI